MIPQKQMVKIALFLGLFLFISQGCMGKKQKDKNLMKQYLSFTINNAQSKHDKNLEKAKLVCSRLDPELYGKFFRLRKGMDPEDPIIDHKITKATSNEGSV